MPSRNSNSIAFGAKRVPGGYQPVADGNDPGGYWGGQKVFLMHLCHDRQSAADLAETLFWERINREA